MHVIARSVLFLRLILHSVIPISHLLIAVPCFTRMFLSLPNCLLAFVTTMHAHARIVSIKKARRHLLRMGSRTLPLKCHTTTSRRLARLSPQTSVTSSSHPRDLTPPISHVSSDLPQAPRDQCYGGRRAEHALE